MTNHRSKGGTENNPYPSDFYDCSTYTLAHQKRTHACSGHYIRTKAVRELVLETIRTASTFAIANQDEFMKKVRSASQIRQAEVAEILTNKDQFFPEDEYHEGEEQKITGVRTVSGGVYRCKAVVLCTGTYLRARCLTGEMITHTGPNGLSAANHLTDSLVAHGIQTRRFKTGTPARVDKRSLDFSKMEEQFGDERVVPFSFTTNPEDVQIEQASCWLTYTNETTHEIIRNNLDRSPIYAGIIEGTGPRYCPSIEDKVVKFADKNRHQIFIEPEGLSTNEMYVGGMSSSLPEDVQVQNEDELGELVHAFNKMKYATGEYIMALEEKRKTLDLLHEEELEKLETEKRLEMIKLELLKSQINPHFLFNTLNVISGMARLEEAQTTEKMILALSSLFRYNLKTPEQFVLLAKELNVAADYMYLQQMRFGDRITYRKDCSVDADKVIVPAFTFQPLVENAMKHGIDYMEEPDTGKD